MSGHDSTPNQRHRVEGPRNHYLSYILSISLTVLAFIAALYQGIDKMFVTIFILVLAVVQVVVQVYFWMHAKDRGHFFPVLFLTFGGFVAFTAAIAALYWMWW